MRAAHFLDRARHGLLLAALLCVLVTRAAVPAGWMPMAAAHGGITLAPCSGMGAMRMAAPDTSVDHSGHETPGMTAHATHDADDAAGDTRHPDLAGDHPCSSAGLSVALDVPMIAVALRPMHCTFAAFRPSSAVAVGRGLAAPPPPATGPPSLV